MPKSTVIITLILISLLLLNGCTDDDNCSLCPQPTDEAPLALVDGDVYLMDGILRVYGGIYGTDGLNPEVDSVIINGQAADLELPQFGTGRVSFDLIVDLSGLVTGDMVEIEIHTPHGTGTGSVAAIDRRYAPTIIAPPDTVPTGTAVTIGWSTLEHGDWYKVNWAANYICNPEPRFGVDPADVSTLTVMTGTTYFVPDSLLTFNGWMSLHIQVFSGSRPDQVGGNISGGRVQGTVISMGGSNATRVYVGTGVPEPM